MSYCRRLKYYVLVCFLSSVCLLSAQDFFYYDNNAQQNNCLCQGSWVVSTLPDKALQKSLGWEIYRQSIDLKESIARGEDINLWGKGLFLQAPEGSFRYAPLDEQEWSFPQGAQIATEKIFFHSKRAQYYQSLDLLQAHQNKFLIQDYGFWGSCELIDYHQQKLVLQTVSLSACPPTDNAWSLHAQFLSYDAQTDTLVIESPSLHFGSLPVLTLPDMSFDGLRAQHRLENFPHVSVATQAGVGISFPMLWTRAHENIEVIPQINLKKGPGIGVNIQKNDVLARGFLQLIPPSATASRYWMVELVSSQQPQENFSYAYKGALISDDDFVYAYPQELLFEERLYYVNRSWAQYDLHDYGKLQFYAEKLYRSQEAKAHNFEVIENTAHVQWSYQKDLLHSRLSGDLFHRYNDTSYQRLLLHNQLYWSKDAQLSLRLLSYPQEEFGYGSSDLIIRTPNIPLGQEQTFAISVLGRSTQSYGATPLIDTVAQPLSFQSLSELHWHQGDDWVSQGLQLSPELTLDFSPALTAQFKISYALSRPTQPWIAPTQPYLTPFLQESRFSPLGLSVKGPSWDLQALFDFKSGQWVTSEWRRSFEAFNGLTHVGYYYHRYFPVDRLSYQTSKVAQCVIGYRSAETQPVVVNLETRFNLIPVKLERALLDIKYQHCCWSAGIKAAAMQQYDSDTQSMKWQYQLSFSVELLSTGLATQTTRQNALNLMTTKKDNNNAAPCYHSMIQ